MFCVRETEIVVYILIAGPNLENRCRLSIDYAGCGHWEGSLVIIHMNNKRDKGDREAC